MTDRLPPQSLDAERAVLGAAFIDADSVLTEIGADLRPEDFYRQAHAAIYQVMLDLHNRHEPVDIVTVTEALEMAGELEMVGGRSYLVSLAADTPSVMHAASYARVVGRKATLRSYIGIAGQIAAVAYDEGDKVNEAIDKIEGLVLQANVRRGVRAFRPIGALLGSIYSVLDTARPRGLATAFRGLDDLTGGLRVGNLVIVAARPSVGKTSLALNIAERMSLRGLKVGFFSLEMSQEEIVTRLVASVGPVDGARLSRGQIQPFDFLPVAAALNKLAKATLFIDDTPTMSILELRSKARRLQSTSGLNLLIVDYLQLMHGTSSKDGNRVQEVSEISRGLKALARELSVPVIALSQLSRQPEMRESKEPRLSDLRESGGIEQDADLVVLMWNDGETVHAKLAKNRNGPTGEFNLHFYPHYTRFVDA